MSLLLHHPERPFRPLVVLDTNAVFDWMVFDDRSAAPLGAAIAAGQLRWAATAAMRDECFDVLARGHLAAWRPDLSRLRSVWADHCELHPVPAPAAAGRLRCRDPSDQMFIDLAFALRARWLVSEDRAVRHLARPMRAFGIEVIEPAGWVAASPRGGVEGASATRAPLA